MINGLPLPVSPRKTLDTIAYRITHGASTWLDAIRLRDLAHDQWTPDDVRHEAQALYEGVADKLASAAIVLTEYGISAGSSDPGDIRQIETIACAKELPILIRHAAARLVGEAR